MGIGAYPSPWFWRLRMAAEAAEALRRTVVVVNFIVAPAQGLGVFDWWLVGSVRMIKSIDQRTLDGMNEAFE
jgi:hypothetical protein